MGYLKEAVQNLFLDITNRRGNVIDVVAKSTTGFSGSIYHRRTHASILFVGVFLCPLFMAFSVLGGLCGRPCACRFL